MKTSNPIKWHGGKSNLASYIISHMPPHKLYREPFFGSGAVLFKKEHEGISEVINDIDRHLIEFFEVLRDTPDRMLRRLWGTPFSDESFASTSEELNNPDRLRRATAFFIKYRQSRQGLGKDFATPTCRVRRGMNENVSAWLSAVEGLAEAHERLKRVEIRNMDACEFINKYDDVNALFYCDPPYIHETRHGKGANKDYVHEMDENDHQALLNSLAGIKGKFLLSGYPSTLYDWQATCCSWRRIEKKVPNAASSKKTKEKKTECLWMNY